MTPTRRQTVFAGLDPPRAWPPPPRALRPQRLDLALDSLPGVAATTQRKLGKLGLATVRDVLEHRPRRYETAADEVSIAALREGATEVELASAVAFAAATRIARFPTSNEFGDWDTALHTFTFANAVEQGLRRSASPELVRGVLDAARERT